MAKNKYGKPCPIEEMRLKYVDYKNIKLLLQFISKHGRIVPKYYSGVCLQHQRMVAGAIKKAREMALIPYSGKPRRK